MRRRREITKVTPNPKRRNIFLDSNALDDCSHCQSSCIEKIIELNINNWELNFMLPQLVAKEIEHPNTPSAVKRRATDFIYTIETSRNEIESNNAKVLTELFRGNSSDDRHDNDSDHIFETIKYGGGYFITEDKRIQNRCKNIDRLYAVSRHEFLEILMSHGI